LAEDAAGAADLTGVAYKGDERAEANVETEHYTAVIGSSLASHSVKDAICSLQQAAVRHSAINATKAVQGRYHTLRGNFENSSPSSNPAAGHTVEVSVGGLDYPRVNGFSVAL